MSTKKKSLSTLSNEALCRLRDEIAEVLDSRAEELRRELKRLTGEQPLQTRPANGKEHSRAPKRNKLAPKYRGPDGKTWCGRGARPQWLANEIRNGKALGDFLIPAREQQSAEYAKHTRHRSEIEASESGHLPPSRTAGGAKPTAN